MRNLDIEPDAGTSAVAVAVGGVEAAVLVDHWATFAANQVVLEVVVDLDAANEAALEAALEKEGNSNKEEGEDKNKNNEKDNNGQVAQEKIQYTTPHTKGNGACGPKGSKRFTTNYCDHDSGVQDATMPSIEDDQNTLADYQIIKNAIYRPVDDEDIVVEIYRS